MLALSASCAPAAALGDLPLIYPFVVNDPGEGVQAKRRAHATIVDHLVPPMMRADSYDELAELEALLDEYARLEVLDPPKLPALAARIWSAVERANLQTDLDVRERPDDMGELVQHIDGYLCEIKDIQVKDGLHVLGRPPEGEQLRGLVSAMLRLGSGDVPGLRTAVGAAFGLDEPALVAAPGAQAPRVPEGLIERFSGPSASAGDLVDRLEDAHMALLDGLAAREWSDGAAEAVCADVLGLRDEGVARALRLACREVVPRILRTGDELTNVVRALHGRHVESGPSGAPTRGRLDVLPTGRNFYSVDPRALPSELSWEVGQRLADALLDRHREDTGKLPRMVGLVAWGTAAMRTQGDDVAEILALLGVRPTWHVESHRVTGIEVVALAELGRPRIDVTVRISGFFRDAFPHLVRLLDDAVATVAALDEADEDNLVAAHARADAERLAAELGGEGAWRRATTRVFGSKPGTYGAGLLQLLEARDWRDDDDLAAVYEAWGGYAYGRGLDGAAAQASMRDCYSRIEVAVKNVDSREHDILDSDDYYQYHGGMIATVRALTGREPQAYLGDSSDPSRVVARTLAEETRRVFRARVANPRWIASMIRHGYKGAAELSATVDYLFGYDATAGVAEDWMYEQVAERYLLDADVAEFMARSNPWAARGIAERLLEAADRGMWAEPGEATLAGIRERFLALEGELEEAQA
jgi:cobaltochelatase CobN